MTTARPLRAALVVGGMLAALGAGCGRGDDAAPERVGDTGRTERPVPPDGNVATRTTRPEAEGGHEGAPLTVTGCLQHTGSVVKAYVLTTVNSPATSVGTSGVTGDATAVAREQRRQAWHAYRVTAKGQDLERYVGQQIQVTGTLEDTADLKTQRVSGAKPQGVRGTVSPNELDLGDLGRIEATSVETLAQACGESAAARRTQTRP